MTKPIDWRFDLPLKDERELRHFVKKAWGVRIPDVQVCENHTTPWRAFADAYFARSPIVVWKASRGFGGKTFLLAVLALTEAATLKSDVNVLGGSGEQSENVHLYTQGLWFARSAPRALLASDPVKRHTRLIWGNWLRALMASQKSVRGPHPQRLRLDEIDEMELTIFDSAMGQPMSRRDVLSHTVCSSTHQYADRTMSIVLERAERNGWPVYEWCISGDCGILGVNRIILMKEIQKGDRIYAYDKGTIVETTVTDAWCSGVRRTIIIDTARGNITCTPEHKILTDRGWRRAGNIQCGEMVCEVRNAQGDTLPATLQDVSLRQEVSGLQQADQQRIDAMQVLRLQAQEQPAIVHADEKHDMSEMRRAQAGTFQNVSILLQKTARREKSEASGYYGIGERARSARREKPQAREQVRKSSRGALDRIRIRLSATAGIWALRGRFCIANPFASYRGQRAVLAQQPRTGGARPKEMPSNRSPRVEPASSVGRSGPSLGFAAVRSIRKGPFVPVYDLTVADGHSFIANGIVVHNCYRESMEPHGWLSEAEVARKRVAVTNVMWLVEYEGQEPSPESRAIMPEKVAELFDESLGEFDGDIGEYIEIEQPIYRCQTCGVDIGADDRQELFSEAEDEPKFIGYRCPLDDCGGEVELIGHYLTGADWARKADYTVIITWRTDVKPARLVAFERTGRRPWPVMVGRYEERVTRYPGQAAHDGTGLGDVIDGYLTVGAESVIMVGRTRSDMLSQYISAIERGELVAPKIAFMRTEHRFASVDDVYGKGHLPDSIAAGALAWAAREGELLLGFV